MKINILPAVKLTVCCIVLFVGIYSTVIWAIARVGGPNHGEGATLIRDHKIVGFENVGQSFTEDKYFWSRPSAVNYNAAGSGGSNKGPSNPGYLAEVKARIDTFMIHNPGVLKADIPAEMVTASGSGLDPHISYSAAKIQIPRIARIRKQSAVVIQQLIEAQIEKPWLHIFGPSQINVLKLNIALDNIK